RASIGGRTRRSSGSSSALLELVALARQRRERGLEEVVRTCRGQSPRQQPSGSRREDLRRRKAGRRPCADAAAARHELADRLLQISRLLRLLAAGVRLTLDERRPEEA